VAPNCSARRIGRPGLTQGGRSRRKWPKVANCALHQWRQSDQTYHGEVLGPKWAHGDTRRLGRARESPGWRSAEAACVFCRCSCGPAQIASDRIR